MEGYGLYWYCLELIAANVEKHNLTFELEHDAEIIAHDIGLHQDRVEEMMRYMIDAGLFESDGITITCMKMASRTDEYTQKLLKQLEILQDIPRLSGQTPDTAPRKSELIEENRIENNVHRVVDERFKIFWSLYPRKEAKRKAETAFKRLTAKRQQAAIDGLSGRFDGKDRQFIMLATTYLNGARWEDEIEHSGQSHDLAGAL